MIPTRLALVPWLLMATCVAAGLLWRAGDELAGLGRTVATGTASVGGPFTLTDQDGHRRRDTDFRGRYVLVYFGYSFCPDVCPTTLGTFKQLEPLFAKAAPALPVSLVFVSVDPERDDGEQLRSYTAYFSPRIVAASGTKPELDAFTRQLGVLYAKVPLEGSDYTIDHSTQIMLIDPEARLAAIFRPPHDAAGIVADVRTLAEAAR